MCRNIRPLFNFEPPATDEEVRAASVQFVRKISGFTAPSKANQDAFNRAIDEIAGVARRLVDALETNAPKKNREEEAQKAKARAAERYGTRTRFWGRGFAGLARLQTSRPQDLKTSSSRSRSAPILSDSCVLATAPAIAMVGSTSGSRAIA